ncbi:hypothetical protein FJT64_026185 [Amphibalanus amphitrite]|uniref:Uncharacterized protein n=1 Tax=Amphibalanus amphitrite TaxID=1232801 RepID=A0A6A4W8Q1_AMPAM|nr:hypothetical protein FJT64_026185 [Amphibalanus amphitrite]
MRGASKTATQLNNAAVPREDGGGMSFTDATADVAGGGGGWTAAWEDAQRSRTWCGVYMPSVTNGFSSRRLERGYQQYASRQRRRGLAMVHFVDLQLKLALLSCFALVRDSHVDSRVSVKEGSLRSKTGAWWGGVGGPRYVCPPIACCLHVPSLLGSRGGDRSISMLRQ